eukprot:gnl/TRDRNA2_/TRDRNA2_156466_c0_seq1.p1 gnl/TRDRNA2_/TRDRNA2_156466_c0~~gnl/TRDRNA2_/TRDRNA2_156466_c0_seq1.p1  ORF type:complete len:310 (+),score=58.44 gnl/TRDRNA2_/TRDRNA2_156466_c0_seq1:68-931(+)
MEPQDRIGLRTTELWVLKPEVEAEDSEGDDDAGQEPEQFLDVKVTCQASTVKKFFSSSGTFTVRLEKGTTVEMFRRTLPRYLPEKAKIFAEKAGRGLVMLQETEAIPEEVTVSAFNGTRGFYTRFSKRQGLTALRVMRRCLRSPEVQERLDRMMDEAHDNQLEYRARLVKYLAEEVYPLVFQRLGLPQSEILTSPKIVMDAMSHVSEDLELAIAWYEVETLMRNMAAVQGAVRAIFSLREKMQLPLYDPPLEFLRPAAGTPEPDPSNKAKDEASASGSIDRRADEGS